MANLKRSIGKRLRFLAEVIDPREQPPQEPAEQAPEQPPEPAPEVSPPVPAPAPGIGRFMAAAPLHVEVMAGADALQHLVDVTSATWSRLGAEKAHWSVLTWPEFLSANIDEEVFYRTGVDDLGIMNSFFERAGLAIPHEGAVLELGCGVGRLTRHFCTRFSRVQAVDISQPHLALARKQLSEHGCSNVDLVHLVRPADLDALPQADLFFSIIVLQHNPPPVAYDLLGRCLRRVREGGYAYFQVPTYRLGYAFSLAAYEPDKEGAMEMHVVPQGEILKLLHDLDFQLLEVQEDGSTGDWAMASHTFFCRRKGA